LIKDYGILGHIYDVTALMMGTEMVPETSVILNQLTWLITEKMLLMVYSFFDIVQIHFTFGKVENDLLENLLYGFILHSCGEM
jgi:hypothetical protein